MKTKDVIKILEDLKGFFSDTNPYSGWIIKEEIDKAISKIKKNYSQQLREAEVDNSSLTHLPNVKDADKEGADLSGSRIDETPSLKEIQELVEELEFWKAHDNKGVEYFKQKAKK